jgi:phosphotransferase system HPr (HPr) family protein
MSQRASIRLVLRNERGMHARPCHAIASAALESASTLRVRHGEREVDGRSILSLMTLGAACGAELEFVAQGSDATALIERLRQLVEHSFAQFD